VQNCVCTSTEAHVLAVSGLMYALDRAGVAKALTRCVRRTLKRYSSNALPLPLPDMSSTSTSAPESFTREKRQRSEDQRNEALRMDELETTAEVENQVETRKEMNEAGTTRSQVGKKNDAEMTNQKHMTNEEGMPP
jgi:hypothetical protein